MIRPLAVALVLCFVPATLGAQPAQTAAAAPAKAAGFAAAVAVANEFEIRSGELMIARSATRDVRELAQRLIDDHAVIREKLELALADSAIALPPAALDTRHRAMLQKLKDAAGEALDKAYIEARYEAHTEAVELVRAYAKDGDTPRLKAFAADLLPTLEEHLEQVKKLRD